MDIISSDTTMQIRRLDAHRVKHLEMLHTAVYGCAPEKGMYHKKYATAFTGQSYLGFIAYGPDGTPAAYYGVIPCFMIYHGRTLLAAQSADTMTHPAHRKKGLFVLLAGRTYDLCREVGVQLLFGFPNQNSYHTFVNSLGWTVTDQMQLFIVPVKNTFPITFLRHLLRPHTGLPHTLQDEGFGCVLRDKVYLSYKTYRPSFLAKAGAAQVWFKPGSSLLIGDITAVSHWDPTISALTKLARRLGSKSLSFQACPGTLLHAQLVQGYAPQPSFPVITMDLGAGIPMQQLKFSFADIDIF